MAKFKDLHLLLQEEHRILFGDDSLGTYGPTAYPATNPGSEKPFIAYTTISGYNTTYPGMGVTNIAGTEELVVSVPLAGERATQDYHMVRYDQLLDAIFDETHSDWQDSVLTISGTPPGSPNNGDRYIVDTPGTGVWNGLEDSIVEWNTASGTWDVYSPNEGFTTFVEDVDKYYLYYNGSWAPMGEGIDHGDLIGLEDDDHIYYVPTDGSRGFTATVSGIYPTQSYHLTTKQYVDDQISTISGVEFDHGDLNGLGDDDHTQYTLTTGARGFTGTVSGIDPTESYHLTTRWYVDDLINTVSGVVVDQIITDHGELTGLGDDDHTQYILVDGSRGFTGTVSGIDPTESYHLTTRWYVDNEINTLSGTVFAEFDNYVTLNTDQTISGSKTFDGPTVFNDVVTVNSGIEFGSSTISGTGTIHTGEIFAGNQKWGRVSMIDGVREQAVTFGTAWPDDDYTVVTSITNEVDATPSIYSATVGVKDGSGFTVHFSGKIDSNDFVLEYHAFYGQFN